MPKKRSPALIYILKAFIPYSRESIILATNPHRFFNELERLSGYSEHDLRTSYYRARKSAYITNAKQPKLTSRGRRKLQPFVAKKLNKHATLMVIFDIPEDLTNLRRQFRNYLRELHFTPTQQSVWMSSYDHRVIVEEVIDELGLREYVQIYEAAKLFPIK